MELKIKKIRILPILNFAFYFVILVGLGLIIILANKIYSGILNAVTYSESAEQLKASAPNEDSEMKKYETVINKILNKKSPEMGGEYKNIFD